MGSYVRTLAIAFGAVLVAFAVAVALALNAYEIATTIAFAFVFALAGGVVDRVVLERDRRRRVLENEQRDIISGRSERRVRRLNSEIDLLRGQLVHLTSPRVSSLRVESQHFIRNKSTSPDLDWPNEASGGDASSVTLAHFGSSICLFARLSESGEVEIALDEWLTAVTHIAKISHKPKSPGDQEISAAFRTEGRKFEMTLSAVEAAIVDRTERLY